MANLGQLKRKASTSKSLESISSRVSSPDLPQDIMTHRKRGRHSTSKPGNESSTDSFSYSNYLSEGSSDSEFEEHPYSRSKVRPGPNSDHRPSYRQRSARETSVKESQRSKCTSKNAVMARLNRQKKKKYIEDLENKNAELEAENQMLKNMLDMRAKEVESLKKKTLNLESVIRNKTEIGSLLRCVRQHTDLEISSSLLRRQVINPPTANIDEHAEKLSSKDLSEVEVSPSEEEVLVAAVLWGMALHTFCQPYKLTTST